MPTSSDISGQNLNRAKRPRRRTETSDPVDPRNDDKPLAELAETQGIIDADYVLRDDFDVDQPKAISPFWDPLTTVAVSISFAIGSIIGVPIGLYIHVRFL